MKGITAPAIPTGFSVQPETYGQENNVVSIGISISPGIFGIKQSDASGVLGKTGNIGDPIVPHPSYVTKVISSPTYTTVPTDQVLLIDASANNVVVNLMPASTGYGALWFKRVDGSTNSVTINGGVIDAVTSIQLFFQYETVIILSDLSKWHRFPIIATQVMAANV